MKRRDIILAAGAALLGTIAHAQVPRRYRLGVFWWGPRKDIWGGDLDRILHELGRLGYERGVRLEVRECYGTNGDEVVQCVRQLVAVPVDVLLTEGTGQTLIALDVTKAIPIVTTVGDPVASGFARTLKTPGGNVTGIAQNRAGLARKQIELLRVMRPGITEAGVLGEPYKGLTDASFEAGLRLRGLVESEKRLDWSLQKLNAWHINTAFWMDYRIQPEEAAIAIRHRIALMALDVRCVEAGALMAVDTEDSGVYARVASIIDKIFKGEKPGNIPFEQAGRFVTAINARTAAALGIRLTPEIRLRVDRIIE